ncbi:hypothetical protein FACS189432_02670 [Bacteroidia bacterium]|nr:hypothetical protein FACS189426_00730 [Bacteroidia bacterium]GHT27031.1 hypothetical protein FACS189432_02670 [Bacteroidia bacterium]
MKTKFLLFSLVLCLFIFTSCSDNDEINTPPINVADCGDMSGFVKLFSDQSKNIATGEEIDDFYIIKGVIAGKLINNQGREIKIAEDLKGNTKSISSIFLWGNGGGGDSGQPYNEFGESLSHYAINDTLVVMFKKMIWEKENGTSEIYYATSGCGCSILKFSKGDVTGRIFSYAEKATISMEELQSQLFLSTNK